ncbi:MAG: aspartate dehydrogenase [Tumebacillaceae bacterium]
MLQVGIIGYGTIGQDVVQAIREQRAGDVRLHAVLVRNSSAVDVGDAACVVTKDPDVFFNALLDLVIEPAGHGAVQTYAERALRSGSDLLVVSVGAFCDETLYEQVRSAAVETGKRLILPSCAIAGLDRIAAGAVGNLDEVKLCSRKPPKAWYGTMAEEKVDLANVTEPVCIFSGTARESARLFPESVNVSAALSLAGVGFDRTQVEVYVDPTITQNTHEIHARGQFGSLTLQVNNTPSQNPKTGYIVAMSIIKVLRNLSTPFVIGI